MSATSQLDTLVTCSICYEHYTSSGDTVPYLLACSHSFCLACLRSLATPSFTSCTITCAECRHITKCASRDAIATTLKRNITAIGLVDIHTRLETETRAKLAAAEAAVTAAELAAALAQIARVEAEAEAATAAAAAKKAEAAARADAARAEAEAVKRAVDAAAAVNAASRARATSRSTTPTRDPSSQRHSPTRSRSTTPTRTTAQQQTHAHTLPAGWEEVIDPISGKLFYQVRIMRFCACM